MYSCKSYFLNSVDNNKYKATNLLQRISHDFSLKNNLDIPFCLFLDIDGTLSEFHPDPTQSFIPQSSLNTLQQFIDLKIPVIAVTGRSVKVATKLLSPLQIPIAGTHGLEIRLSEKEQISTALAMLDFALIQQDIKRACLPYPKLLIEDKPYSVALHYRQCPQLAEIAEKIVHDIQALYPKLKINTGKYVYELLPQGADKGQAIETILGHFNLPEVLPIFIGDDQTDESAFKTINQAHGISIKVGTEATAAHYRLHNIQEVATFLDLFSHYLKKLSLSHSEVSHGEKECLN